MGDKKEKQRVFKVYKYTLNKDGRVYIGQTCNTLAQRAGSNGYRYKGSQKFYHAIQKYGWENFIPEIIADNLTVEQANRIQSQKILEYDSIKNGFNLAYGGNNRIPTEETRMKQSLAKQGQRNNRYGVKLSEQTKHKIGKANSIALLGKHHTEETKKKMSESHKKEIYIQCVETGEIFHGPTQAARAKGKPNSKGGHISQCCNGKRLTAFKYHWQYTSKEKYNEWNQFMREMVKK